MMRDERVAWRRLMRCSLPHHCYYCKYYLWQ